jgi:phosphatidylserine decarboxylase
MKYSGKALSAALRLIGLSLAVVVGILALGVIAKMLAIGIAAIAGFLVFLWLLFAVFTIYFFRDPTPIVPSDSRAIAAPAHGKVDVIDEITEKDFMGGPCRRVSIFLSVVDVHVQQAPVTGKIVYLLHTPGQFLNAMRSDCAQFNENVLIGVESSEAPGEKIGLRLIAGLIARRIGPFVAVGDSTAKGERIGLIQFGSRVDIYLPLSATVKVKLGDRVVGGQTVVATRN